MVSRGTGGDICSAACTTWVSESSTVSGPPSTGTNHTWIISALAGSRPSTLGGELHCERHSGKDYGSARRCHPRQLGRKFCRGWHVRSDSRGAGHRAPNGGRADRAACAVAAEAGEQPPDVTPSAALSQVGQSWPVTGTPSANSRRRYRAELASGEQAMALAHLRELATGAALTLLTASRDPLISEAAVLAELLQDG